MAEGKTTDKEKGYVKIPIYYTDGELPVARDRNMFYVLSLEELKALQRIASRELKKPKAKE